MNIIVLGGGQVGLSIAKYLSTENNFVTIVDRSEELLKTISDTTDIRCVQGYASYPEVLEEAGASSADVLIAVTGVDEVNIVACEIAASVFQVPMKIARLRNQAYHNGKWSNLFLKNHASVDVIISPEIEVANVIYRALQVPGAFYVVPIANENLKLIGIRATENANILNTPLRLLPGLHPHLNLVISFIKRGDDVFIPSEDDLIQFGDELYFIVPSSHVYQALEAFGFSLDEKRHSIIMGGGNIGLYIAQSLEDESYIDTKIIEKDKQRALEVAKNLHNIDVLCGDVLDPELLEEASVSSVETTVAVTHDDKVNILASLLAKKHGAQRTIALLNNMTYSSLVMSLGIDSIISPKSITVSSILQHIRKGKIHTIQSLGDGYAEIVEADVKETSSIMGMAVGDISIKRQIVISAIIRPDEIICMPPKRTIVHAGDKLIITAVKSALPKLEKLFALRPSYLV